MTKELRIAIIFLIISLGLVLLTAKFRYDLNFDGRTDIQDSSILFYHYSKVVE